MVTIHDGTEDVAGNGFEFLVRTLLEGEVVDMAADIEIGIVLPGRKADIKRRCESALGIAGEQREPGRDGAPAGRKGDISLEHADTRDIEGHARAFKIKKEGVAPGEALAILTITHRGSPLQVQSGSVKIRKT
jgi:hypothetical protein